MSLKQYKGRIILFIPFSTNQFSDIQSKNPGPGANQSVKLKKIIKHPEKKAVSCCPKIVFTRATDYGCNPAKLPGSVGVFM